ncbi:acetyl-CoA carboxylase biotin carboxyl carrier protein [Candidatus Ishikawella capsulata]|uniref:Biotin carboxyl carrier protein of acetyl-CoA carboxylase n=1 Tax=Candidatus Ishikawaella capsulata Mpkobe TaxID=476281 RepID=C5WCJ4_9ENTR|nr:acetyl-CoA carboxylase biotin carboxyl carrier protein [Candidatus Ishikawaella capsulata]BAH83050.1 acetyl-CoA carboxylase [Candidatus Ishikawaella capsulata Mpkobe]
MDIRKIKKLVKLVECSNITELKISEDKEFLYISKKYIEPNININSLHSHKKNKTNISETSSGNINRYVVRSPMVGIFYRTPHPEAKAFIQIGQKINRGDTLCIIEAMKMMNYIEADREGFIKAILVENGQSVEFDEPLVVIE